MQIDKQRQRVVAPVGAGISHYHLPVDEVGTMLHHARLTPLNMASHDHEAIQVTVALGDGLAFARSHSSIGSNQERRIRPGQCYIVPPRQEHGFSANADCELLNMYLHPHFFDFGLRDFWNSGSALLPDLEVYDDPILFHYARNLRRSIITLGGSEIVQVEAAAIAYTDHLANRYLTAAGVRTSLHSSAKLPGSALRSILDFVHEAGPNRVMITDLAKVSGYSAVHFRRLFYNSTGYSPLDFLYRQRLFKAQALLRRTNLSVQEIAIAVGFSSSAHFVAQFRAKTGYTPTRFRKDQS